MAFYITKKNEVQSKIKLSVFNQARHETYGGMEVYLHAFFTSVLDEDE